MRNIIFLTVMLLLSVGANAQFLRADHKKAEQLKYRPLIVALFDTEEEAGNTCDSLHMAWYNQHIREAFEKHWTLSDSIIFMKSRKVASVLASRSHDYVIFSAGPSREGQQSSGDIFWYPSFTFMLYLSEDGKKFDSRMVDRGLYSEPLVPDMEMTGQLFRGKYIFKISIADLALSDHDLVFALKQFDRSIRQALSEKRGKTGIYANKIEKGITAKLKGRSLLIPDDLDPEGTNEQKVMQYYKKPFRIATEGEIDEILNSGKDGTAYIHYLWSDRERMFQGFVIDSYSLEVLAMFRPGYVRLDKTDCLPAGKSYRNLIRISTKRLKSL